MQIYGISSNCSAWDLVLNLLRSQDILPKGWIRLILKKYVPLGPSIKLQVKNQNLKIPDQMGIWLSNIIIGHLTHAEHFLP